MLFNVDSLKGDGRIDGSSKRSVVGFNSIGALRGHKIANKQNDGKEGQLTSGSSVF